ncbi:MAG: DUF4835 family protein [Bacteroidales bacterium]|nr:DUF4835 family protein [Bacteroidales bacterium]
MRKLLIYILFFAMGFIGNLKAQDVLCNISVSASQVQGTDRDIYNTMQRSLMEWANNRKWTPYNVTQNERFEITFSIQIADRASTNDFSGSMTVVMRRLIYHSNYNSPIFNFKDKDIKFYFNEFEPIQFIENSYTTNIVSIIAFYVNYCLGITFDTYQNSGGSPFFSKAQNIINVAQTSREPGWNSNDGDKSRYGICEHITNTTYRDIHSFLYQYHREGLDVMADNVNTGRGNVLIALESLRKVYEARPGIYLVQMFLDAKRDEIVNIFKEGTDYEKNKVIEIMNRIDPANSSTYNAIKTSGSTSGGGGLGGK